MKLTRMGMYWAGVSSAMALVFAFWVVGAWHWKGECPHPCCITNEHEPGPRTISHGGVPDVPYGTQCGTVNFQTGEVEGPVGTVLEAVLPWALPGEDGRGTITTDCADYPTIETCVEAHAAKIERAKAIRTSERPPEPDDD